MSANNCVGKNYFPAHLNININHKLSEQKGYILCMQQPITAVPYENEPWFY